LFALALFLGTSFPSSAGERPPQPAPLSPADAEKEGRKLAAQLLAAKPAENSTNSGTFRIRDSKGKRMEIPVQFRVLLTPTNWTSVYATAGTTNRTTLEVIHTDGQPTTYCLADNGAKRKLVGNETMVPFAASDFWIADLGLEFFHWPTQRVVKKEMRKSQFCKVLESVNPHRAPGSYARVVCWIDHDSLGIIQAEAYDQNDQLLKEFDPKEVQKVEGQWQVREMEIRNRRTSSRTQIEFDLGGK
jgi:hypothetical protein